MTTDELLKALEKALPDTYFEVTDSGYKNLVVVNFTVEDKSWRKERNENIYIQRTSFINL